MGPSYPEEGEDYLEVQGEVALVEDPKEEGQEADLGKCEGVSLVVVLELKVRVKALGVLAF